MVKRLTEIPEYYRIPVKNTGIPVKTPILALIKKRIYSEDDLEKPEANSPIPPNFIPLFTAASDLDLRCLSRPICSNI